MIKISVIMPLFNASKYLEECLQSISRQTFSDYELICVNDASDDSTSQIVQDFQKKDSRVRLLTNDRRSGAAYSRNRGMKKAEGKYIAFLDGDDIFDEEMLEKAYCTIERHKADIVMYDFMHVPSDSIYNKLEKQHNEEYIDRYCRHTFTIQDGGPYEFLKWSSGPWNKLYRKSFVEKNKIVFQNLSSSNDIYFVCMALMLSDRLIAIEDTRVMVYIRDHFESTRISNNRIPICAYKAYMKLGKELIKRDKFGQLFQHYYTRVLSGLLVALGKAKSEEEKRNFYVFLKNEGIAQLRLLDISCYSRVNPYIRCMLEAFQEQDYESQWYCRKDILGLESHLYYREADIARLFQNCTKKDISVGIWGAGKNGQIFLKFCMEHHFTVAAICDQSAEKQGSMLYEYEIISPAEILDKVQLILVSAFGISHEVIGQIGEREIEVIDLNSFLKMK